MDVDEELRRAGQQWRQHRMHPMQAPDFEGAARGSSRPDRNRRGQGARRLLIPVAAAVGVAGILGGGMTALRSGPEAAVPAATPDVTSEAPTLAPTTSAAEPTTEPTTTTPTEETTSATDRPPRCAGSQLEVTSDETRSATAAGSVYVALLVRNKGKECWLSGWPTITGVDAVGVERDLHLDHGIGPALLTAGPGVLPPGARGLVLLKAGINLCTKPDLKLDSIRVTIRGTETTIPMPALLRMFGCGGSIYEMGPLDPADGQG